MLEDDRKNLGVLETVIVQYGIQTEPKETFTKMIEEVQKLMEGSELTLFEKVAQHELLKHKQTMAAVSTQSRSNSRRRHRSRHYSPQHS